MKSLFCSTDSTNSDNDNFSCLKKGVGLETHPSLFAQNDHLQQKLFLCCLSCDETRTVNPNFYWYFSTPYGYMKSIPSGEKNLDGKCGIISI